MLKDARWAAPSLIALACAAASQPAAAQFTANPYVDAHYEHDSNVFRAPSSAVLQQFTGDGQLGDSDEKVAAGVAGNYLFGEQSVTGTVEARHFWYDHYSELDHTEYMADLLLKWRLTSLLDGTLDGHYERVMAPFQNGDGYQLFINQNRSVKGVGGLNFTPDWRLEAGGSYSNSKQPLVGAPDFTDREIGAHGGLLNHGVTNLTYGLTVDWIDGLYENAENLFASGSSGKYYQKQAQLTATYQVGALTKVNGAIGYTKRNAEGVGGSQSGVTGQLGYTRQITPKTSVSIIGSRNIQSYAASGGSELDLSGTAAVTWQTTYRLGVTLQGGYTRSTFDGQQFGVAVTPGGQTEGRIDKSPTAALNVNYQVLRHLKLRAYGNWNERDSNLYLAKYNDTTVGIEATYVFGPPNANQVQVGPTRP